MIDPNRHIGACILCSFGIEGHRTNRDQMVFCCPCCGDFAATENFIIFVEEGLDSDERAKLAGVVRERNDGRNRGEPIELSPENYKILLSEAPSSFDVGVKARKLLSAIAKRSKFAGDWVGICDQKNRSLGYAETTAEFIYLCTYIIGQRWCEQAEGSSAVYADPDHPESIWNNQPEEPVLFQLTPAGWEIAQTRPRIESTKAFVAMWFNEEVQSAYDSGIHPAIHDDCGFRPVRIDTEHYNGDVVDQVLAEINESRFVVADLTGHRNGVYFEAGYAMGQGIPVIWTCRDDAGKGTHFDAEHFNQIRWKDPADLRDKLQARIRATIGRGPLAPAE